MSLAESSSEPRVLTQIANRLHEMFDGHIDLSNVPQKGNDDAFLTRSYLALFLVDEVGLSPSAAGACITDDGDDDGIDAICIDKKNAKIYFGQSKWKKDATKGIALPEFTRFRDGVKAVIELKWSTRNKALHRFKADIEQLLKNIDTEVILVFAHTSSQPLSIHIEAAAKEFIELENLYTQEFMSMREFRLKEAAQAARSLTRPENISFSIMLSHWGWLPDPFKAVYGSISALDVVGWYEKHGNKLFAENLRFGIEKSDVNDGIISTADKDPDHFWYYNNGITAICDDVLKQSIGGPNTQNGVFDVDRISVINGAQTITSLHKARQAGSDLSQIRVHFRVISLFDTPDGFASSVTSANNTQNDLNPVDFVAADPNQDRIRREAAQLGLVYSYRRGDKEPDKKSGFTIRSATVAAACSAGDLRLAVSVKRYISGLWENTKKEPYTKLFNSDTSATHLWKMVQIMNVVDEVLSDASLSLAGRERLTAVHANRFTLFVVYQKLSVQIGGFNRENNELVVEARLIADEVLTSLFLAVENQFPDAYPGNIFKNQERQGELLALLV